jgi:hypothetical protein
MDLGFSTGALTFETWPKSLRNHPELFQLVLKTLGDISLTRRQKYTAQFPTQPLVLGRGRTRSPH